MLSRGLNLLNDPTLGNETVSMGNLSGIVKVVTSIASTLFGVLTVAAVCLAIFLAYKFFTAADENKRKDAKKQLIYAIIGIIVLVVMLALTGPLTNMITSVLNPTGTTNS